MARGSGSRGTGTFGLTSSGRGNKYSSNTRFRGGRGRGGSNFRGRGGGRGGSNANGGSNAKTDDNTATQTEGSMLEARFEEVAVRDEVDQKLGFPRLTEGLRREGWLVNMFPVRLLLLRFR
jgi:DNA polymerase epsilon subunit 1